MSGSKRSSHQSLGNNLLIRSGEAPAIGWSRNMLYSGFNTLPRSIVRRQTGFAARITRTLSDSANGSPMKNSNSVFLSVISVLIGLAGFGLNLALTQIAISDAVLGILVLLSIAMIGTGCLPRLRNWRGQQWATRLMTVVAVGFIVYAVCTMESND